MIEVLALAGAVTKVASSVSAAVKAGRDIQSLMPQVGKLAKLEADINLAETGKHKNPFSRLTKGLTSSEEEPRFTVSDGVVTTAKPKAHRYDLLREQTRKRKERSQGHSVRYTCAHSRAVEKVCSRSYE